MLIMKKIVFLFMFMVIVISIQGCDQLRSKLADAINPKTPQQVLDSALQKVQSQKYQDALIELENHPTTDPQMAGKFAWVAAQASFQIGQFEKGYDYLTKSMQMRAATIQDAMTEPLFEPVRTQPRFTTVLIGAGTDSGSGSGKESAVSADKPNANAAKLEASVEKPPTTVVRAGPDASVTVDANGRTTVKAGDASVKLP